MKNSNASSDATADALTLYFQATSNEDEGSNSNATLTPGEIDSIIDRLNSSITRNSSRSSFLMVRQIDPNAASNIAGAWSGTDSSDTINNTNIANGLNRNIAAAAVFSNESLSGTDYIKVFIINNPVIYRNISSTDGTSLVSPMIVASRQGNSNSSMSISLYFTRIYSISYEGDVDYGCAFYDNDTKKWSQSGCTDALYNDSWNRYECNCNHTTSFGLIWLPSNALGSSRTSLRPVDIASLVFQSLSIVCFLIIIVHALAIRIFNPIMSLKPADLLPLISCASTTILFIFYIALGLTVYTRTSSANETQCFLSSKVLMFFVYFFLIFMFCTKTTVGYFNYLRFVYLFPQPSFRRLYILLLISFMISIGWVSFAAGFDSNSSYAITHLYPYVLCWFPKNAIYYFLTIPVCIFLILNFITIICVGKHIIQHVRRSTSPHQSYERMKRCVLVLLSSCVTQGIGWLFGPFISFANPTAGEVLEWFFVVFNGLEGVWSILLYIIIRSQRIDEQKRVTAVAELTKTSSIAASKYGKPGDIDIIQRNRRREPAPIFNDLNENRTINWPMRDDDTSSL